MIILYDFPQSDFTFQCHGFNLIHFVVGGKKEFKPKKTRISNRVPTPGKGCVTMPKNAKKWDAKNRLHFG